MATPTFPSCPKCGSPRVPGAVCPRCGVLYAKAEARAAAAAAATAALTAAPTPDPAWPPPPPLEPTPSSAPPSPVPSQRPAWDGESKEAALERTQRLVAAPAALLGAWIVLSTSPGHFLGRTFLSMWVHEFGHAVAGWFCGFLAIPGPWFTSISDERSIFIGLLLAAALVYVGLRSWLAGQRAGAFVCAGLLVLQLACTLGLGLERARAWVTFAGDGGSLVLGAALMATFYVPRGSLLHRGALRWGFLVIGAVAFVDAFEQWWSARTDSERIPYGENVGVTLSDPTKLTEQYGWTEGQMVRAYVGLGLICLAALAVLYGWGLRKRRSE